MPSIMILSLLLTMLVTYTRAQLGFTDRIDQSLCKITCRLFIRAHKEGCCALYNVCCSKAVTNLNALMAKNYESPLPKNYESIGSYQ
ncbi:uncharacterized protein NPIL_159791 [Nephila pilipes]|uniref:Spider venom protein n=1 Tax=Nephila pilipes TaxID=299642 RepID=A0A8X6PU18_NEPPI|nr:uncharacterized protein NPIL_159791 [Nephila pilipes]